MATLAIASDHAGLHLRRHLVEHLQEKGHEVKDLGPSDALSVDYPDYAALVAHAVQRGEARFGILVCGTGVGMAMAANRVPGVRAAVCSEEFSVRMSRAHNDANVLCLGERVVGVGLALSLVDVFLTTAFERGRHERRVDKLTALEKKP